MSIEPSTGAGPQVPSALQKCEAQSSSTEQVSPAGPEHPAALAMLQSSKDKSARRDVMGGTLRP
jgi:hypothetical protein